MMRRGRGRLLLMGSGMGLRPQPLWSAYGVSKAAISRLMDSLAAALDGSGVTVLEISPGLVRTDMTETMWGPADEQPWNDVRRMVARRSCRFAAGDLDALHGRFVHAARDDLDALVARAARHRPRRTPAPCGCAATRPTTPSPDPAWQPAQPGMRESLTGDHCDAELFRADEARHLRLANRTRTSVPAESSCRSQSALFLSPRGILDAVTRLRLEVSDVDDGVVETRGPAPALRLQRVGDRHRRRRDARRVAA